MNLRQIALMIAATIFSLGAQAMVFPFLKADAQNQINTIANYEHSIPCPGEYTNLLTNTNLFSSTEQSELMAVRLKYQDVTTNNGPSGSVFTGWKLYKTGHPELGAEANSFFVACFTDTNSNGHEEIKSERPGCITAKFRTESGDGYDAVLNNGALVTFQQYRHNLLDGLFVAMDPNKPLDQDHCGVWMRFANGRAVGKFLMWGNDPSADRNEVRIVAEAEFKQPFDFIQYQSIPFDLAWERITN
jgi:hypothetical protein